MSPLVIAGVAVGGVVVGAAAVMYKITSSAVKVIEGQYR